MRCPQCGSRETRVIDSRDLDDGTTIRRRRECEPCGVRFTTYERVERTERLFVIKRDGYGQGQHRWNDDFLDMAKLYGFMPRLCRPYRARTKGKVERFHRYLRGNFYVPLDSRMRASGLIVDADLGINHRKRSS